MTKVYMMTMLMWASCVFALWAQQSPSDSTWNSTLQQVVVTGTGTHHQQRDAVVPVQVLTAYDLRRAHVTTIEDALVMLSPSISTMTNGMGTTLSINGLPEDYILVLENGHRLTGDDRYTRINMASVKRIEVLPGASSVLYGSEAIGGVINIITSPNNSTRGQSPQAVDITSRTQVSSKGRIAESLSAHVHHGHLLSNTSYQRMQASNYQVTPYEEVLGQLKPTGRVMGQGYHSDQFAQRLSWRIRPGLQVYVRGSYYDYHTERPQAATYYKGSTKQNSLTGVVDTTFALRPAYSYDLHRRDYLYGAGATWRLNSKAYFEADFYSDNLNSERDSFYTIQPGGTQLTKRTHYYNGTLRAILRLGAWNKVSAGAEYEHETYCSYNFPFRSMYTMALYAQDEMLLCSRLQAIVGLRYIYNQQFGSHATPTVQLMYSPGPVRLRAGYSTGFRTPTLLQMYYENDETKNVTLGNVQLRPEKSNFYQLSAAYYGSRWRVQAEVFYNQLRDMISYRTLTTAEVLSLALDTQYPTATKYQQRDNINKAMVRGFHLSAEYYLPMGLRLGGAYTYCDTEARSVSLNVATQQYETTVEPVDRSIRNSGTAHVSWSHSWRQYDLNVRLQSRMQGRRWSTSYGWAPGYAQIDLNTTHTWHLDLVDLEPGIGIQNLTNKRDTRPWCSNFSTVHPGRCVYVSFTLHFLK